MVVNVPQGQFCRGWKSKGLERETTTENCVIFLPAANPELIEPSKLGVIHCQRQTQSQIPLCPLHNQRQRTRPRSPSRVKPKIPKHLILRTFQLPIINPTRRILVP